jgi:ABC-type amino acid transport substrate-binding protein
VIRVSRAAAALAVALSLLVHAGDGEPASDEAGAPRGVLRLCADPDNLPFSSSGAGPRGLYVDVAELVAARLGLRTEYAWWYTFYGKRAVRNTLLADRCDAFFGLPHDTDFMGRTLILTRPFLDVGWAVAAPPTVAFTRLDDLKGRRLGVVFRSGPQLTLAMRSNFTTTTFRTDEEALAALGRGEIDAAFVWGPTAGYHGLSSPGAYRVVPIAGEGLQWKATVAVRKGETALRDRIDGALASLESEIRQLADRYGFPRGPAMDLDAAAAPAPVAVAQAGALPADAEAIAAGRSLFNQHCSHCHAPNAMSPELSRDLRRLRIRYGTAYEQVFYTTVMRGRPDRGMPSAAELLDAGKIERVWAFVRSVQAEP